MNKHISTYPPYGAFVGALCAWIVVGYFAAIIHNDRAAYIADMQNTAALAGKEVSGARLHSLASENAPHIAELDAFMAPSASSIIDAITAVGTVSGAPIKINGALAGNVPKGQKDLHAVAFIIESTGTFSAMIHVLSLFEVLPVPSSIELVDLSQVSEGANPGTRTPQSWHLNLKVQVFTTAPISS